MKARRVRNGIPVRRVSSKIRSPPQSPVKTSDSHQSWQEAVISQDKYQSQSVTSQDKSQSVVSPDINQSVTSHDKNQSQTPVMTRSSQSIKSLWQTCLKLRRPIESRVQYGKPVQRYGDPSSQDFSMANQFKGTGTHRVKSSVWQTCLKVRGPIESTVQFKIVQFTTSRRVTTSREEFSVQFKSVQFTTSQEIVPQFFQNSMEVGVSRTYSQIWTYYIANTHVHIKQKM